MFLFFSNRLGCLTSVVVSLVGSVIVILLMKGCRQEEANVPATRPIVLLTGPADRS